MLLLAVSASAVTVPVRVQAPSGELLETFTQMLVEAGVSVAADADSAAVTITLAQQQPVVMTPHVRAGVPYRLLQAAAADCDCIGIALEPHPADQLNLLHQLLPRVKRVGVIAHSDSAWQQAMLEPVAQRLGLAIKFSYIDDANALPQALSDLLPRVGALLLLPDDRLFNSASARHLLQTSYRQRRPVVGPDAGFVRAGALASVYPSLEGYAQLIARLLPAAPGALQRQTYFPLPALQVNEHVARNFGIVIDDADGLAGQLEASR